VVRITIDIDGTSVNTTQGAESGTGTTAAVVVSAGGAATQAAVDAVRLAGMSGAVSAGAAPEAGGGAFGGPSGAVDAGAASMPLGKHG
jgi:hypothetical protein